MQHGEGDREGAVARIHIAHLQPVNGEGLIFLRHLGRRRQLVDGGIVDRLYQDGQHIGVTQGATAAGIAPIVRHHGQGVIAMEVRVALIGDAAREQGIEIRQGAGQHHIAGAVAGQGHAAPGRQGQGAVLHREAHFHDAVARIHVLDLQTLDDERLVLLCHLGIIGQHVDGGVVDRAHIEMDGAVHFGAEGAVVQALGRHLDRHGAVGVMGHELHRVELAPIRGDLPAATAEIHYGAAHPARQADFCPVRHPFQGDAHLLGPVLVHIAGIAAGGLGIPGLHPQVQGDHIPFGAARLLLHVGDDRIPHRIDGDGEARTGFKGQGQPLVQGEGAQGQIHGAAEVRRRDQGQLGEVGAHRHLPHPTAVVDRRGGQGEAIRHPLDLQPDDLLGAIVVDEAGPQPPQAHAAIFLARDVLDREVGRIVHRQHLEAHVAAPAPPIRARGGGIENIHRHRQRHLAAEVLLGHEHQILEIRRVVHREGGDRLAVLVEEVTILGIHGHDHPLHGLETAIGHRGADVSELDREIEMNVGVFQVVRLAVAVYVLHVQLQLGQAVRPAVDVHLRGDGEGDVLLHHLGVTAHGVGVDQAHVEVQAVTGIVLRQGQGQLVEIIEAARQLDQVLAVDEVKGEPLHVDARGQTCDDDAELVVAAVRRAQGHHVLELAAEVDALILHPGDGGAVVKIDIGGHLARVGRSMEVGAGGDLPIGRGAHIPLVVVTKVDHPGAHLEGDGAGEAIRRAQGIAAEGVMGHGPVALAVVDPAHHHEAGGQIADHQVVDDLIAAGVQILEHEDAVQRDVVPVRALQLTGLHQVAIGLHHRLDIHMQGAVDHLLGGGAGVHIHLRHRDMALEGGVPVAVFGPFHQQLATAEQALQLGVAQVHGAAAHGQLGLDPTHADPDFIPGFDTGKAEVGHLLGAVGQVRLPVEDGELILQAMAGLGIVGGVDGRLHLDGEGHVEALVIAVVLGHHHVADQVQIGGAVGGRLDLQVAEAGDIHLIERIALAIEPGEGQGQLLATAVEYPGPFRQPFQHQVEGFRVIERGIRPLPRGELEVQRCPAILLDGDAVAVAILGPVGGIEIEMGFIHHPHQIHVQALAAGLLLVHHGVGLAAGIGQDGGVLHHPLDGEIEIDVAVFGRQQLEVIDAVIGHLVIAVGIQGDRHPTQQQGGTGGQAADAHEQLLGAICGVSQMGEPNLAAQIDQGIFLALDLAHRQLGVVRQRVHVDNHLQRIAEGRLLAGHHRGLLRAHRGHNELDVTAVVLAGHHGHLVDVATGHRIEAVRPRGEHLAVQGQRALAGRPFDLVAQGLGAVRIGETRLDVEGDAAAVLVRGVVLVRAARIPQGFVGNALHRDVQIAGQHRGFAPLGDPHLQLHREAQRSAAVVVARVVVVRHEGDTGELELVIGVGHRHHGRGRHLIPGLAPLGDGGQCDAVEIEGALGVGWRLDKQLLHMLAPIEIPHIQVHGDGDPLARIARPRILLAGDCAHGELASLVPDGQGQKTVVGISVAIHQVEAYLLYQGAVAVIDARFGGEAVVTLGIDHQGADDLPRAVCHRDGGVARGGDGVLGAIDGHRSHHRIIRPLAGSGQQIAGHFRPFIQGLARVHGHGYVILHAHMADHFGTQIPVTVPCLQWQLDIQQILALDAVIQVAGQLEGVAAGHIQGQLEDELACAVLAKVDTRLAVCPYGDRLAPRRQGIEGVEAGYIQLQGNHPVTPGGDRHLADGNLSRA